MTAKPTPKDRAFLVSAPMEQALLNGKHGTSLKVRLTSYRALPLSCIDRIEIAINGEPIDPARMTLSLNGVSWPVTELAQHSKVWWWVLDYGEVFITDLQLAKGPHRVTANLVTVEPYITAGRFHFHNSCEKQLFSC